MNELELMRLHANALFAHDGRQRMTGQNQWDGGAAPRFFLGRTPQGHIWRYHADLSEDIIEALEPLCRDEPAPTDHPQAPRHLDTYLKLLSSQAPISRIWTGPAYWFSEALAQGSEVVALTEDNVGLLQGGLEDWMPDVPHRQPFMAAIEGGRAVSVCASVRITDAAHEAGVETLPMHRGRGHGSSAVVAWARAVRELGACPLYSTSWDNTASQRVAARLGMSMYGVDFHVA